MEREVFRRFYDETVAPSRDMICKGKEKEGIKAVDNFEGVYEEYLNQKTLLKLLLKKEAKEADQEAEAHDKNQRLDRHKISACITAAIVKTRLISDTHVNDRNGQEYLLRDSNRMNEQLAFYCGMSNLMAFMTDESDVNKQELENFHLPKTNYSINHIKRIDRNGQEKGEQDYRDSIIRALYYANTVSGVQPLMLSNIFFLLEAYHSQACELNRLKAKD